MNASAKKRIKIYSIAGAIILITFFHYVTQQNDALFHVIYRELYFLPIILAGFYFGLRGGLISSGFVTLSYLPYIIYHLDGFSSHDLGNFLQIMLFTGVGSVIGWLRDREKILEAKRRKSESLAAMGKAVSCIAHDMKTPLIAVGGLVQQVRRKVTDEKLINKLDYSFEQVRRLEVLIGDMLAFAKPLNLDSQQGMINHLIEEIVMVCSEKAKRNAVRITTILQKDMPITEYDNQRLHQALVNLVNNAIEASPSGSEVTLRCQCGEDCMTIEISDRGCGIPKDLSGDIYTPFVTTKKEGTGLGLPIVKKIIDAHEGSINVTENNEIGVTFQITLPLKGS